MSERTETLVSYLSKAKKKLPKGLDDLATALHEEVFESIDCLTCAECCRTLGPRISRTDIVRLAQTLGLSESAFETRYLQTDEDGDYVFRSLPCPFLGSDNYCLVYAERPKACRDYPHTDRNFRKTLPQAILNLKTCPAVRDIVKSLMKRLPL